LLGKCCFVFHRLLTVFDAGYKQAHSTNILISIAFSRLGEWTSQEVPSPMIYSLLN
jgi:hypothetical protein